MILDVTANEINGFYDPRSLFFPGQYTGLRYEWSPIVEIPNIAPFTSNDPTQVRLASWLRADTVLPANVSPDAIARDTANQWGYIRFYGNPHNPDVVPGGELLEVRVTNYPPDVQTIDSLKGLVGADTVAKYIFLYPPYFNCQVYDPVNARYLQQDTVNISSANTATYRLRIFVQDSIPIELNSAPGCFDEGRDLVIAQWTNQLRFNYDVNTDDELEDNNAAAENWDFRYGRTTYDFVFTDRLNPGAPGDVTDDVTEIRPVWMGDQYLQDANLAPDNGATVLRTGNIIVRIDSLEAATILRNPAQANNTFNLDSVFTLFVNDGHTGQNKFDFNAIVNAQPRLDSTIVLEAAQEDFDYNPTLLDLNRAVRADDLNRGQRVLYYLVYADDALNSSLNEGRFVDGLVWTDENGNQRINDATTAFVERDTCYTEAGLLVAVKSTPSWLRVNPVSGILYGTPGLNDAPRQDSVTVVAIDEYGLSDVRRYPIQVDATQHDPDLRGLPPIRCVIAGEAYKDSLCVSDRDLGRLAAPDVVTLTAQGIVEGQPPLALTVVPGTLNGPQDPDSCHPISIESTGIPTEYAGRKMLVEVVARDQVGNTDTLRYEVAVSEEVDFAMSVTVRNTNVTDGDATQEMFFGLARNATTGEQATALGRLDSIYCEYELPPLPPTDVFDARWTIPTRNGILRNFFPTDLPAGEERAAWKAKFQPGFLEGGSPNFPIVICWSISAAQAADEPLYIADLRSGAGRGENVAFRVNMKDPTGHHVFTTSGVQLTFRGTDTACVEIIAPGIADGFKIFYDIDTTSSVDDPVAGDRAAGFSLAANVPNPVTNSTEIGFYAPKRSDVRLDIFDANGKLVTTLLNETVPTGRHSVVWNGTNDKGQKVASGSYTYRLTSGPTVLSSTMILTR